MKIYRRFFSDTNRVCTRLNEHPTRSLLALPMRYLALINMSSVLVNLKIPIMSLVLCIIKLDKGSRKISYPTEVKCRLVRELEGVCPEKRNLGIVIGMGEYMVGNQSY